MEKERESGAREGEEFHQKDQKEMKKSCFPPLPICRFLYN